MPPWWVWALGVYFGLVVAFWPEVEDALKVIVANTRRLMRL